MGIALGSEPMSAFYGYRAELANQVIVRLKRLTDAEWLRAAAVLEERRRYFDLAHTLSAHSIAIMAEEEGEEGHALLQAHLSDVDTLFADAIAPDADVRRVIGRAAVLAVFLRDTRGFNHGAFIELFAPAAVSLSLAELAATANAAVAPTADDFSSTARSQPSIREPERKRA
jgi:hypothetical protein